MDLVFAFTFVLWLVVALLQVNAVSSSEYATVAVAIENTDKVPARALPGHKQNNARLGVGIAETSIPTVPISGSETEREKEDREREDGITHEGLGGYVPLDAAPSRAVAPLAGSSLPELVHEDFWLVCTMDGTVHARDSASGSELWKTSLGEPLVQSFNSYAPSIGKVVPGDDGSLYIYTHDDKLERYELSIPELVNVSPKVQEVDGIGKLIIVGEFTTFVYSLDVATGQVVLKTSVRDAITATEDFVEPEELVNIAKRVYTVRAFEEFSGKEVWNFTYGKFETPDKLFSGISKDGPGGGGSRLTLEQVPVSSIFSVSRLLPGDDSSNDAQSRSCPLEEVAPWLPAEPAQDTKPSSAKQAVTLVRVKSPDGTGELIGTAHPLGPDLSPLMENGLPSPQDGDMDGGNGESKVLELVSNSSDGASIGLLRFSSSESDSERIADPDKPAMVIPDTFRDRPQSYLVYVIFAVVLVVPALWARKFFLRKPRERWIDDNTLEVGQLTVHLDKVKGRGCHGTVVYSGKLGKRPVAVKRMLSSMYDVANKEVELLIRSDGHPNVVRYFAQERCRDFVYLALELCTTTMDGAIRKMKSQESGHNVLSSNTSSVRFLSELVSAVAHLHDIRIVHCDIKPQNILMIENSGKSSADEPSTNGRRLGDWSPKLSDMGLGRKISDSTSSIGIGASTIFSVGYGESQNLSSMQGAGTQGWRAAELLQKLAGVTGRVNDRDVAVRCGRMVDVFALGCVFFYTLTLGSHPFGDFFEREKCILNGDPKNLKLLKKQLEAYDLVRQMIGKDPEKRPTLRGCQEHPFFWSAERRIQFLCSVSNRLKVDKPGTERLKSYLEMKGRESRTHPKTGWFDVLDDIFKKDLSSGAHTYDYWSTSDLLRFMRNKYAHLQELRSLDKDGTVSSLDKFWNHFNDRFPNLLLTCYHVVLQTCVHETAFAQFVGEEAVQRNSQASKEWYEIGGHTHNRNVSESRGWFLSDSIWVEESYKSATKGRASLKPRPSKYKVTLCAHWERTGGAWCAKGKQCGFAHGRHDLRHRRLFAGEKSAATWRGSSPSNRNAKSPSRSIDQSSTTRQMFGGASRERAHQKSFRDDAGAPPPPPGFEHIAKARHVVH